MRLDVQTALFIERWEEAGQVLWDAATKGDEIARRWLTMADSLLRLKVNREAVVAAAVVTAQLMRAPLFNSPLPKLIAKFQNSLYLPLPVNDRR